MSEPLSAAGSARPGPAAGLIVVAVCFLTIVFDGYDLIVYGSAVPSLLAEPGWDLGPAQAGAIGSYALVGHADRRAGRGRAHRPDRAPPDHAARHHLVLGRDVACALAPGRRRCWGCSGSWPASAWAACIPSAIALTVEYAPAGRRQLYNALMFVRVLGRRRARRGAGPRARGRPGLAAHVLDRRAAAGAGAPARGGVPARVGGLPDGPGAPGGGGGARRAATAIDARRTRTGARAAVGPAGAVPPELPAPPPCCSGRRASAGCCSSTGSTPGCRRSCARPATRSARRCSSCWCSTSARSPEPSGRRRWPTGSAPSPSRRGPSSPPPPACCC